jgi:glycosyltransferase involved in cell wall biosynthesis
MRAKVLFAIPELDRAGPDRVFFELLKALDRSRFHPMLLCDRGGGHYWQHLPDDVLKQALVERSRPISRYPILRFARATQALRPDVVITTLRTNITAALAKALGLLAPPLIVRPANHLTQHHRFLIRKAPLRHRISFVAHIAAIRAADHVVCQGEALRQDLISYAPIGNKSTVIGNPVDIDLLQRKASEPCKPPDGRPALLAVGRLAYQKGFDMLIAGLPRILDAFPNAHLTILGEGPERGHLENDAAALGVRARVTFLGVVENPWKLMSRADLIISSSRYEGFANAVLEALACARPVVATDSAGAIRDLVVDDVTGWLCEGRPDARSLAARIIHGLNNTQTLQPGKIAEFVRARYSPEHILPEYEELFLRFAGRRTSSYVDTAG